MSDAFDPATGGCSCGHVRYRVNKAPLVVHGCHCTWCQRQTGTAFATNALVEAANVEILQGAVEEVVVPSPEGSGQAISRCPECRIALWSEYLIMTGGKRGFICFIRVGTLDDPTRMQPDVHIYTSTKVPWMQFPEGVQVVEEFYDSDKTWSAETKLRFKALREKVRAADR